MPGLAVRKFECTLCQQQFTLLSGDLILPGPRICDECLVEVWALEGEALANYVAERLLGEEKMSASSIVQRITFHQDQWKSAEEAIGNRERERGVLG